MFGRKAQNTEITTSSNQPEAFKGSGGTLVVGRKVYAIGLIWEGCEDGRRLKEVARQAAHSNGADLFCIRNSARPQYGLGSMARQHKPGMPPLAAFLAQAIEGSFIAVFKVNSGYYLVAVREDMVLAGYDIVYASESEAINNFTDLLVTMSNWDQKICPKEWSFEGASSLSLEDVLLGFSPKVKLEQTSRTSKAIQLGGIISLIILLVGSLVVYHEHEVNLADEQRAALERARAAEKARLEAMRHKFILPALPWEGNPMGYYLFDECVKNIMSAKIDIAGWRVSKISCTLQRARVTPDAETRRVTTPASLAIQLRVKRNGGTINWIGEALNRENFHPEIIQSKGEDAVALWKVPNNVPLFPPESTDGKITSAPPGNLVSVSKYLITNFDELFTDIDIKEEKGDTKTIPLPRGNPITAVLEHHLDFTFLTKNNPTAFAPLFLPIEGFVLNKVELDLHSWEWLVTGDIYERTPIPSQNGNRH